MIQTKTCRKCGETKELSEFSPRVPDGYHSWCRACKRVYDREFHSRRSIENRARKVQLAKERKQVLRVFIREYLLSHPCVDCGEDDPIVLDFDHVRGSKVANLSEMGWAGFSIENITTEIEKCEIRCANCHRRVTHSRRLSRV